MQSAEYRRYAAECLRRAETIENIQDSAAMIALAHAWLSLAELAEKQTGETLVYETPDRHQRVAQQQQQQPQSKPPDKTE